MTRTLGRCAVAMVLIALFSQPVAAENDMLHGRSVYVTNRGYDFFNKPGPHLISQYVISPAGEFRQVGEPVPTGLGARGIVVTSAGRSAHAVAADANLMYSYRIGSRDELIPNGALDTGGRFPFAITGDPRGRMLYVANFLSGTVSVFAVEDGRPVMRGDPVVTGANHPRNVAVSPDGRLLYVVHGFPVDTVPDVLIAFPINANGTLGAPREPVPIGATGMGIGITPDGTLLYVICTLSEDVHGFHVGADGELTPVAGSPFPAPTTPEGVAITPDGRTLFVTSVASQPAPSPADDGLWTFRIESNGSLTSVRPRSDIATGPGMSPSPDGRHLLVGNFWESTVTALDVDTLREIPGAPRPSGGLAPSDNGVVVLPNRGPTAAFDVQPGHLTRFDATSSEDGDGRVVRYDWDFGDGTTLRDGGPRPLHVYRRGGSYRVTLVVTDDEGCSTTFVWTGRNALCTGSPAGQATRTVTIQH